MSYYSDWQFIFNGVSNKGFYFYNKDPKKEVTLYNEVPKVPNEGIIFYNKDPKKEVTFYNTVPKKELISSNGVLQ